jgi:hypothetical protein
MVASTKDISRVDARRLVQRLGVGNAELLADIPYTLLVIR